MQRLVSPEEMARADKRAISSGTPAEVLMDRAGRAIARSAAVGGRYGKRLWSYAGRGTTGAMGSLRRVLASEGLGVTCLTLFDPQDAPARLRSI